jgi:putative nucleotidyltransferase with HDIG domain
MFLSLPLPEHLAKLVYYHHEYHDGSGIFGLAGDEIPEGAEIICFSSAFDDLFGKYEGDYTHTLYLSVLDWLEDNRAKFSAWLIGAFERLVRREHFLLDYFNRETKHALSENVAISDDTVYGFDDVEKYALCFADLIDRRSPFTFTHSHGIARLAEKAALALGYSPEQTRVMYISGLLHDIGKLHVSTDILHKPGKLSPPERFEINKHTYYTRKILCQVKGFEIITEYAANHHERLDGTGYPYHLTGERLSEPERVVAVCDVYQALTEERPYRAPLPREKVWAIIRGMAADNHLDKALAAQLEDVF